MAKFKQSKSLTKADECVSKMPPLRHSIPGEPFDIRKSAAARWLCSQPEVMQWVFNKAKDRGAIVYDRGDGTWRGADYAG